MGYTDHLQMVTTNNYNVLANSCIRPLTIAHTKFPQFVFNSRFLVPNSNNDLCLRSYRLANVPQLTPRLATISHQPPTLLNNWTELTAAPSLSHLKHFGTDRTENTVPHYYSSTVTVGVCLVRSRYSVTALVYVFISPSFSSKGLHARIL
jgi:hypothetical protein